MVRSVSCVVLQLSKLVVVCIINTCKLSNQHPFFIIQLASNIFTHFFETLQVDSFNQIHKNGKLRLTFLTDTQCWVYEAKFCPDRDCCPKWTYLVFTPSLLTNIQSNSVSLFFGAEYINIVRYKEVTSPCYCSAPAGHKLSWTIIWSPFLIIQLRMQTSHIAILDYRSRS